MKLLVATGNAGKLSEIRALTLTAASGLEIIGLGDLPSSIASVEIEEDGDTFVDNARKKATTLHRLTGLPTLADDSGLVVEALGGQPGVHSARYAGPDCVDTQNNAKLLHELAGVPAKSRHAAFVCSMILIDGAGQQTSVEGRLEGLILNAPRGTSGFGYDPVFRPEGESRSVAEMNMEEKNRISHRGGALRAILPTLLSLHTDKRRP